VTLKNEGNATAIVTKVVLTSDGEEIDKSTFLTLEAEESYELSCDYGYGDELSRDIGIEQVAATMKIFGHAEGEYAEEQMLAQKDVVIPIPMARIGETIPEIESGHNLSLTLLSRKESGVAVVGPYYGGAYYTFTAKPGMKFIIVIYRFQNNWIRQQETPDINAGEIATDRGHIYPTWSPPAGVWSEDYNPRESTKQEVETLIGDSGAFENLLPEGSTVGRVVFEIPEDETPIEASIVYVRPLIAFNGSVRPVSGTVGTGQTVPLHTLVRARIMVLYRTSDYH
jgi:hypothetical protein